MSKLLIKCTHRKNNIINCFVDGKKLDCVLKEDNKTFFQVYLDNGKHSITITKNIIYNYGVSWLNIFNPLLSLRDLKFDTIKHLGYDENFISKNFVIATEDITEDSLLCFDIYRIEYSKDVVGYCYQMDLTKKDNLQISQIVDNKLDCKSIRRWKFTHAFSSIFTVLLVILFSLYDYINRGVFEWWLLAICLGMVCWSIYYSVVIFNIKETSKSIRK